MSLAKCRASNQAASARRKGVPKHRTVASGQPKQPRQHGVSAAPALPMICAWTANTRGDGWESMRHT
eukprot:5036569-Pleurochrysis_carterae.AAC.1